MKSNKVASLPEVAPVLLLPVPLLEALALCMKKEHNYVSILKYVVKRSKGAMSYFVSLLASLDPLPLPLPLSVPLVLNKNRVKAS